MISVIYYWQPYNKINGTLFYCFEYTKFLEQYQNTTFYIINCKSEKDQTLIIDGLFSKYHKEPNIKFVTITQLYNLTKNTNNLILDIKTYNKVHPFINKQNTFLYCNNKNDMVNIEYPNNMYGIYSYQKFNKEAKLKFFFDIYPEIKNIILTKTWFASSIGSTEEQIKSHLPTNYVFKKHSRLLNIFEQFQNIIYIHNGNLDTNNRLIPEAIFYNKNLKVEFILKSYKNDSIWFRYIDIKNNGLGNYTLDLNDPLIKDILCQN